MIKVAEGFDHYGKQGEAQPWTLNFENAPSGMSFKPIKIQQMLCADSPMAFEATCEVVENPDCKMLKLMQDWMELAKAHNEAPRFTVTSNRKGAFVTYASAPMFHLKFRSRRLAKVYAKKHNISYSIMDQTQC